jgi:hypothetical protein
MVRVGRHRSRDRHPPRCLGMGWKWDRWVSNSPAGIWSVSQGRGAFYHEDAGDRHHGRGHTPVVDIMVMKTVIGIDPGLGGAIAMLGPAGELEQLADLPVITDGRLKWIDGGALQSLLIDALRGRPARAIVERVSAMPRQGVASAFTFGVGFGSILGVLQAGHISIELVTPGTWKRALLGLGADKTASLHKARLLFPTAELHQVKHHGRAEALLLAHYAINRPRAAAA